MLESILSLWKPKYLHTEVIRHPIIDIYLLNENIAWILLWLILPKLNSYTNSSYTYCSNSITSKIQKYKKKKEEEVVRHLVSIRYKVKTSSGHNKVNSIIEQLEFLFCQANRSFWTGRNHVLVVLFLICVLKCWIKPAYAFFHVTFYITYINLCTKQWFCLMTSTLARSDS